MLLEELKRDTPEFGGSFLCVFGEYIFGYHMTCFALLVFHFKNFLNQIYWIFFLKGEFIPVPFARLM